MSLTVNATTSAQINTLSLADSTFKEVFKGDSLGTFALTGGTRQADYTIDAKTGDLTSKAAVANTSANEGYNYISHIRHGQLMVSRAQPIPLP